MRHIYNRICWAPGLLMSVGPPADRSGREHGPVHGWRWRTPDRRWSMSSKRSDNCGKNSNLRDYSRGRSVLRSSLGRHICLLRHEPEQRRGRTCVRESYRKDCGVQRASKISEIGRTNRPQLGRGGQGNPSLHAALLHHGRRTTIRVCESTLVPAVSRLRHRSHARPTSSA